MKDHYPTSEVRQIAASRIEAVGAREIDAKKHYFSVDAKALRSAMPCSALPESGSLLVLMDVVDKNAPDLSRTDITELLDAGRSYDGFFWLVVGRTLDTNVGMPYWFLTQDDLRQVLEQFDTPEVRTCFVTEPPRSGRPFSWRQQKNPHEIADVEKGFGMLKLTKAEVQKLEAA